MGESLQGRVALVTGGARRIGRSIALRLAEEGAAVVVNYKSSAAQANALVQEIASRGGHALALAADVSRRAAVFEMFRQVEERFGRLDILVNNAGVFFEVAFEDLTEEQLDFTLGTNLKAQIFCVQAALPLMRRAGGGRIVNISSIGAFQPKPRHVHYCVSKAGVVMLTRCLARALAPTITVNSVAPGKIQFPDEEIDEGYRRRAALQRVGSGEDIAEAVLYFVHAGFVTGQVLLVDGGRLLTC